MCVIFIAINKDPAKNPYRICLASNRDEYFARPSLRIHRWDEPYGTIIGGRDGQHGGTWLAINTDNGRIGVLLNLRDRDMLSVQNTEKTSRGTLVPSYLTSSLSTEDFIENLKMTAHCYDPFILIMLEAVTDGNYDGYCFSNNKSYVKKFAWDEQQSEVFAGFGNSHPDNPYLKVKNGLGQFINIVNTTPATTVPLVQPIGDRFTDALLKFLSCTDRHFPDETLVACFPVGFPDEFLAALSSLNVQAYEKGYGTRAQTLLLVDFERNCFMLEKEIIPVISELETSDVSHVGERTTESSAIVSMNVALNCSSSNLGSAGTADVKISEPL
ncbi:transport and Golgi organization protein 2-like [Paramacrobiotus metropolitanus]|uniref:transport and Golgi organization protein 2-like n=1 Tax=Paramacrobiotus metropolitanus TaxID=2943436 RepID=UPI0024464733|nr:transport and Golgi organization protein 2-like [Paramacrobiotus metropolitanus]